METTRCILVEKKLPKFLKVEAVNTSMHLLNQLSTKVVHDMKPLEACSSVRPTVKHLKVFRSPCYFQVPSARRSKFDEKDENGVL